MITLFRWIRLQQLRIKWSLALYQFIDQQANDLIKHPEKVEKKLLPFIAELVHNTAQTQKKETPS